MNDRNYQSKNEKARKKSDNKSMLVAALTSGISFIIIISIVAGIFVSGGISAPDFKFDFDFSSLFDFDWGLDFFKRDCTIDFDLNYTNQGKNPESQTVKKGSYITAPDIEPRDGYMLSGWYTDKNEKDWSKFFDFNTTKVKKSMTLHAIWIDIATDTDSDGLADDFEHYIKSDINKTDTDGDGLNDYQERIIFEYDPTNTDSDSDGTNDSDEDYDGDKLSNGDENNAGTNPIMIDTDSDGLSDYDELNTYGTNPLLADTDGDKAQDGDEVRLGSDPLNANTSFTEKIKLGKISDMAKTAVEISANVAGDQVGKVKAERVSLAENRHITPAIPGYIDSAVAVNADGGLKEAQITFEYDTSIGKIGPSFQPRIYRFNETSKTFEELEAQSVSNGKVIAKAVVSNTLSAEALGSSTFILLNKSEYDRVWTGEIKKPITDKDGNPTHIDVAFTIDVSSSMSGEKISTAKNALDKFIDELQDDDRAALVSFNSESSCHKSLTQDKESVRSYAHSLSVSGRTAMYKGLKDSLSLLTDSSQTYGYKVIIILSDGSDVPETAYDSHYSSLVNTAVNNDIVIYTIGVGSSVDTSILTQAARNTGGQYFHADSVSGILDAFRKIEEETVDLTTDSNGDKIPDYYSKLLKTGELVLNNGSREMFAVDFDASPDIDSDGLLNGEELVIYHDPNTGKVYATMYSHPQLMNTDGDRYTDHAEYTQSSDAMIPTFSKEHVDYPMDDSNFTYVDVLNGEDSFINEGARQIWSTITGNWSHQDEAKKMLTHFFKDYSAGKGLEIAKNRIANEQLDSVGEQIIDEAYNWYDAGKISIEGVTEIVKNIRSWQNAYTKTSKSAGDVVKYLKELATNWEKSYGFNGKFSLSSMKASDWALTGVTFVASETYDVTTAVLAYSNAVANEAAFRESEDILRLIAANDNAKEGYVAKAANDILYILEGEHDKFKQETAKDIAMMTVANVTNAVLNILANSNPYLAAINVVISVLNLVSPMTDIGEASYMLYVVEEIVNASKALFEYRLTGGDHYDITYDNLRYLEILIQARTYGGYYAITITGNQHYIDFRKTNAEIRREFEAAITSQNDRLIGYLNNIMYTVNA